MKLGSARLGVNEGTYIYYVDTSLNHWRPAWAGFNSAGVLNNKSYIGTGESPNVNYNKVFVELRQKSGGLKKIWWYNQDSANPIESLELELTQRGSGGCKIKFAYLDIPIEAGDYINVILSGNHIYRGFVENDVDISYPELTAIGYNKRLDEVCFSGNYNGVNISEIIRDVIENSSSFAGVYYDEALIDLGEPDPVIVIYESEYASKILDDCIDRCQNRYWGVDTNNYFYVREINDAGNYAKKLYNYDNSAFQAVSINTDYSKIDGTEGIVYAKDDTAGAQVYVGTVHGEGDLLPIVNKIRRIQTKMTASDTVSVNTALEWAKVKLENDTQIRNQVKVKNINTAIYQPVINDRILVEDVEKTAFLDVDDTQSAGNWSNSSLSTGLEGDYAIKIFYNPLLETIMDLGSIKQWYKQQSIGMYVKTSENKTITISFSDDNITWASYKISTINTDFNFFSFNYKNAFRYIKFESDLSSFDCIIYKIVVLCYDKRQFSEPVINIEYKFNDIGVECNLSAGSMDEQESDRLFKMERKIRTLETINAI